MFTISARFAPRTYRPADDAQPYCVDLLVFIDHGPRWAQVRGVDDLDAELNACEAFGLVPVGVEGGSW